MNIKHIAIWSKDIEILRTFYVKYFGVKVNEKYRNEVKKFSSYFLLFDGGAQLEIMESERIQFSACKDICYGYAHIAIGVGSEEMVRKVTARIVDDGYELVSPPRVTGDGFFESVIRDCDGNYIEITK